MAIYTGVIERGQGYASKNYKNMTAEIAKYFPEVSECGQFGTINVYLDSPFDNPNADHWTPRITWRPVVGFDRGPRLEVFGFIKIKLEINDQLFDGWIIRSEGHSWTYDGIGFEIIAAKKIPGVEHGTRCAIHIDHVPKAGRPDGLGWAYGFY
jgi:hypothetical protein